MGRDGFPHGLPPIFMGLNGIAAVIVSVGAMVGVPQPSMVRTLVRVTAAYVLVTGVLTVVTAFEVWRRWRKATDSP